MRQFSSDQVELTWAGLDLKPGLATGTFVQEAQDTSRFTVKPQGPSGKVVRVHNPNRSGTLTVTVDQESKVHQQLLTLAATDDTSRDQVHPGILNDTSSGYVANYQNMFIMTVPDESRGTESATFAWVFGFESKAPVPIANPTNLVGN